MALAGTHIRFALDLQDRYKVGTIEAYIAGSIYPDSRYVTGIDRGATHPEDFLNDPAFRESDFKKGWHVHLLCDLVQGDLMTELLPKIKSGPSEESWIERTAIKILQDIDDVHQFDIEKYLPCLWYAENPNGESLEKIREYNRYCAETYIDMPSLTIDHLQNMWKKWGIDEARANHVQKAAEAFQKDEEIMKGVDRLYDSMIVRATK